MSDVTSADCIVIGCGIAGASVARWLAPQARTIVLERESQPGYHSTGRSAALYMESYGNPQVRALTRASRRFFEQPPEGFAEHPLLTPRGALFVATESQREEYERHWEVMRSITSNTRRLSPAEACARVPVLRQHVLLGAIDEPEAVDMDVHALHHGFLREMRRAGGELVCNAEVLAIERDGADWTVHAGQARYRAPVVINAAGAWADVIAQLAGVRPIGLEPRRRSAFMFAPPAGLDTHAWPLVIGANEDWYIKPDAGLLLGSPANADAVVPHDVQAEELDVALAIDRIEQMTTLTIRRPSHTWAGLRSFVADGGLVGGFDEQARGFFWLAAQGGYGIQTSAAMGEACAALAMGRPLPARIADFGLSAEMLSPARLER
ncbi:FAD-binding oxidoreductase [Paucibacter sp. R3-3]|uniref:FAD-binding oxidoreductase n=1 Tax=Roseateles agri TaxID=3098619 RepID=A0ABU5DC64_9BURK|nr:FAD-binding oxidoreductase [Paucibacter sp. R3-3]MDY0743371.1 FAD-binding oxidoreductase [Paucibacter sp. R3-3]